MKSNPCILVQEPGGPYRVCVLNPPEAGEEGQPAVYTPISGYVTKYTALKVWKAALSGAAHVDPDQTS